MNSTVGRPRVLTDTQIAEILDWHRHRRTVADVARHYGVSSNTIAAVIRRGGVYKQASPSYAKPPSPLIAAGARH